MVNYLRNHQFVNAAKADWDQGANKKKICRAEFITWFNQFIQKAAHPGQATAGTNLTRKMQLAGLQHEAETAAMLKDGDTANRFFSHDTHHHRNGHW